MYNRGKKYFHFGEIIQWKSKQSKHPASCQSFNCTFPVLKARWQVYIICFVINETYFSLNVADLTKIRLWKRFWQSLAAACRATISSMEGGLFPNTSPCLNKRSWWWQIRLWLFTVGKKRKNLYRLTWWSPFIHNDIYPSTVYMITEGSDQSGGNGELNLHFIQWIIALWGSFFLV